MNCLAFTTSVDQGSVACIKNNKVLNQVSWTRKEAGSEALTFKIKNYLKKSRLKFSDLNLIAVDKGPGSFTGCRVAVNVAKTMAYDLNLPIYTNASLDILANGYLNSKKNHSEKYIATFLDAHRSLYYFRLFEISKSGEIDPLTSVQALGLEKISKIIPALEPVVFLGQISKEDREKLTCGTANIHWPSKKVLHTPQATTIASSALTSQSNQWVSWSEVEPSYIRSPDAVEKLLRS